MRVESTSPRFSLSPRFREGVSTVSPTRLCHVPDDVKSASGKVVVLFEGFTCLDQGCPGPGKDLGVDVVGRCSSRTEVHHGQIGFFELSEVFVKNFE